MSTTDVFDAAVHGHDERIARRGLAIWVGSEPTFTDRGSQAPEWLYTAVGGEKEARARNLLAGLAARAPGAMILRSTGRRYPGEDQPRWSLGLLRRRDGAGFWRGPPDPLLARDAPAVAPDLDAWAAALAAAFAALGWQVGPPTAAEDGALRIAVRPPAPDGSGERVLRLCAPQEDGAPRVELPEIDGVPQCMLVLGCVGRSAIDCGLRTLIVAGEPLPVDDTVELTTVTPDPAVIEVNTAPSAHAAEFLRRSREIYAEARAQGLAPYRLYFNGTVADSGGGGQLTIGGPSPQDSPFLREPRLLSRLVRFLNRHPSLSYLYSHDFVGSTGQSVRADERGTSAFDELALTLELLRRELRPTPEFVWQSLAPFLCDAAGNGHRAEINVEKLCNPWLPGRGRLGLVEFRALRMQHTPERATALACLWRAIVSMLATATAEPPLIDWGRDLHERFALPFYLEQDLQAVLAALHDAGLGLGEAIEDELRRDEFRHWAELPVAGCTLEVRRAVEFWPLLGDAASAEQSGTSRLVDASTTRVELRLRPAAASPLPQGAAPCPRDWRAVQVRVAGVTLPMREERDARGELRVYALRYRSFAPARGLHPSLGAQAPVALALGSPGDAVEQVVTLHEWRPDGLAYPGLPGDAADAARRRAERVTTHERPPERAPPQADAARGAGDYCLDLRHLA